MDFLATFDDGAPWLPFNKWKDNNSFLYRNEDWAVDTSGCTENFTFGPLLGQFVLGFADGGGLVMEGSGNLSSCRTVEQITAIVDQGLADWHAQWIDRLAGRG